MAQVAITHLDMTLSLLRPGLCPDWVFVHTRIIAMVSGTVDYVAGSKAAEVACTGEDGAIRGFAPSASCRRKARESAGGVDLLLIASTTRGRLLCSEGDRVRLRRGASALTMVLPLLSLLLATLLGLGGCAAIRLGSHFVITAATALVAVLGAIATLVFLLTEGAPSVLALPLGLPGAGLVLALDPLAAFFLLQLFLVATAAAVFAIDSVADPLFPVLIAAMGLTLLAGDAWTLVFGFELAAVIGWVVLLVRDESAPGNAALSAAGMAIVGGAALLPALALLAPDVPDVGFAALRTTTPEGWRAAAVLLLALIGVGPQAGLVPLQRGLMLAHPSAPSHVAALLSGAMTTGAVYVLIRVLFDLSGTNNAAWWGVPLLLIGAASAMVGAFRSNSEGDLPAILAAGTIGHIGFVVIGLGLALLARAADLPALAALALGAAMLHAFNQGTFKALLMLGAGAVYRGAGSRHLDRLGGLIHRMPVTTIAMLAGGLGVAALPPGPGFASEWLLFQSALGALRIGGLGWQTLLGATTALMALAAALSATSVVRLIGVAFIGRARTPRAAAAEEVRPSGRLAMGGLVGLLGVMAILPGPIFGLTEPAVRALTRAGLADRATLLAVTPNAGQPGYAALAIIVLLFLFVLFAVAVVGRLSVAGYRVDSAWNGGFAAAPAWLPFGDPATQTNGVGFAEPLTSGVSTSLLAARENMAAVPVLGRIRSLPRLLRDGFGITKERQRSPSLRRELALVFAALVLLLAITTWLRS
jgi:hydrogenase-4 component B